MFLSQLGAQVGVGKQGLLDRVDRLESLLRFDRPDESSLGRPARLHGLRIIAGLSRRAGSTSTALSC